MVTKNLLNSKGENIRKCYRTCQGISKSPHPAPQMTHLLKRNSAGDTHSQGPTWVLDILAARKKREEITKGLIFERKTEKSQPDIALVVNLKTATSNLV